MSAFFIKHPAIAAVIAIVTTLLGLVCMFNLPISQYPEITPRTIQLQAMFPGASAQAVADSVGTPLERQISGVQARFWPPGHCSLPNSIGQFSMPMRT